MPPNECKRALLRNLLPIYGFQTQLSQEHESRCNLLSKNAQRKRLLFNIVLGS